MEAVEQIDGRGRCSEEVVLHPARRAEAQGEQRHLAKPNAHKEDCGRQRAEPAKNGSNQEIHGADSGAGQHRDGPVHTVDDKHCGDVQEKGEHPDVARSDAQQEVAVLGGRRRRRVQISHL